MVLRSLLVSVTPRLSQKLNHHAASEWIFHIPHVPRRRAAALQQGGAVPALCRQDSGHPAGPAGPSEALKAVVCCAGSEMKDEEPRKWDTRLVLSAHSDSVSPVVH